MEDSFIAVLDSGIGGISLLKSLLDALPEKRFLYLGDNLNAPYGNKPLGQLRQITMRNVDYLKRYNLEGLVLGCNTLSVNLIDEISAYLALPVFGVFPPVESALISGEKVLLLSTCLTAKKYSSVKGLDVLGFKNLAQDVEENAFFLDGINIEKNLKNSCGKFVDKKGYYDTLILGCTHYFFVKNKILDHFCPQKIISGNDYTVKCVQNYFSKCKKSVNHLQNQVLFVGKSAKVNENFLFLSGRKGLK